MLMKESIESFFELTEFLNRLLLTTTYLSDKDNSLSSANLRLKI